MLWLKIIVLPLIFHLPEELESVVLEIEGHIDLGPKWIFGQDKKKQRSRTEASEVPNVGLRAYTSSNDEESPEKITNMRHLKRRVTTDVVLKSKQNTLQDWPFEPEWFSPWFSTKKRKKYKYNPFSDHEVNITQNGSNQVLIITMNNDKKAKNHTKSEEERQKQKKERKKQKKERKIQEKERKKQEKERKKQEKERKKQQKEHKKQKKKQKKLKKYLDIVKSLNDTPIQIETNYNSIIVFSDNTSKSTEPTSPKTANEERVTHLYVKNIMSNIFESPHQVKEDERLRDFTVHVYKQSLRALNAIRSKVNNTQVKKKVDFITESYKDKFNEFVNETTNQKIYTKLGTKKVILNTIDTSNRILRRLVNYLAGEIENKPSLRDTLGVTNVLAKEVNNEVKSEYIHVCLSFGICRSSHGFMEFLSNFFSEIARNDDRKLRIFTDAFIDAFENEEFHNVMDEKLKKDFVAANEKLEKMDSGDLRIGVIVLRNMVASRNMPLSVSEGAGSELVERSVALMDVLDALEQKITPTENNKRIWNDITQSLNDWREDKRDDIANILQTLSSHIKDAVNRFDKKTADSVREKLAILFRDKDIEE